MVAQSKVWAGGSSIIDLTPSQQIPSGIICMWSGASTAIPSGWVLCDGNNNTPDLRNRFIVGAGNSYTVGDTGGSETVALSTSQMPSHTHTNGLSIASGGGHTHSLSSLNISGTTGRETYIDTTSALETMSSYLLNDFTGIGMTSPSYYETLTTKSSRRGGPFESGNGLGHTHSFNATLSGNLQSSGIHTHSISGSISNTGGGQSHENRPPYYALCFIMKT